MTRPIISMLVLGLLMSVMPAQAEVLKRKDVTWEAPVPCTFVCPYWLLYPPDRIPGVAGDGAPYACTDPAPEVSYADIVVRAPRNAATLRVRARPAVDWDIVVCSHPSGPDSQVLGWGANEATDCAVGCEEQIYVFDIVPRQRYILRAYNWADPLPLPGTYWFYDN